LKAGAAFMIMDPVYPLARLITYLSMARPRGWLQIAAAGALSGPLESFVASAKYPCQLVLPQRATAGAHGLLADFATDAPQVAVSQDDLACVTFTSGSTGKPKGILGRHRPLTHFL